MICHNCTTRFSVGLTCPKCAGTVVFPHPPELVRYLSANAIELIVDGKGLDGPFKKHEFFVLVRRDAGFVTFQGGDDVFTIWQPEILITDKDRFDWERLQK